MKSEKSKQQIIEELVATHFVENYTRQIGDSLDQQNLDDIVAELYLMICEIPESFITGIYNGCGINCFRRYISGLIVRQLRSTNSKIYRKYKRVAIRTKLVSDNLKFELWVEKSEQ